MVASRKPQAKTARPRHRETLDEKFERLRALPSDEKMPRLTKTEALYFLKRLAARRRRKRPGIEVLRDFYGDWSEDAPSN